MSDIEWTPPDFGKMISDASKRCQTLHMGKTDPSCHFCRIDMAVLDSIREQIAKEQSAEI